MTWIAIALFTGILAWSPAEDKLVTGSLDPNTNKIEVHDDN